MNNDVLKIIDGLIKALADQLGDIPLKAKPLLQAHKDTFSQYWRWSERVQNEGFGAGKLHTRFGWQRNVAATGSPASSASVTLTGACAPA